MDFRRIKMRSLLFGALAFSTIACNTPSSGTKDSIDQKVSELLSQMTLEEKVGQMAQINLTVIANGPNKWASYEPMALDSERVAKAINQYHVGSVLNTTNNRARTPEEWNGVISELQEYASKTRLGIPIVYGLDGIHGATYVAGATMFPQQITVAASWNPKNAFEMARIAAYDTKASSVPWNFSPVLDLGLDARFPRQFETFGEDPYLASQLGEQAILGYQGAENDISTPYTLAACMKHFMGYQITRTGKDRTPAYIPEHQLREIHLPSFQRAIDAGAKTIMINSGLINSLPVHANKYLLTTLLQEELGFKGVILTDWEDINKLHDRDKVASTRKEAIKMAINAGIDMSMVPYDYEEFCEGLVALVKEKQVSEARIDDAVTKILRLKYELNLFEKPLSDPADYPDFGSEKHEQLAYDAAADGITLLQNNKNILPLRKGQKILVTGPNANSMRTLNGAWTYSWQGEKADFFAGKYNTIYEAVRNKFGSKNVRYIPGVTYPINEDYDKEPKYEYYDQNKDRFEQAIRAARNVDVVLLCVGENTYTEKPGDLNDLQLHPLQLEFAQRIIKSGTPVVLVLNEGRPRLITSIANQVDGIIQTYLPGNHGGDALADILSGEVNPSGKLPYSYPLFQNALTNYNYKPSQVQDNAQGAYNYVGVVKNLFDFGHGLSYTTFETSELKVNATQVGSSDSLTVSVQVKNTGKVAGKETVMLFSKDHYASLSPDIKRLRRFEKVNLDAGETKELTFTLPVQELAFVNANLETVVEAGTFDLMIGNEKVEITVE